MMGQLNQLSRTLMMSGLHERFPHAGADELRRRMADILLGKELALTVYGPLETIMSNDSGRTNGTNTDGK